MDYDKNKYSVTCGVPFKDRLDVLSNTLLSIAFQYIKPKEVILVDDSDNRKDLRDLPQYQSIFQLFNQYQIEWRVIFGRRMGQHHSHQIVQEEAKYPIIWRIDSDEIAEPSVLKGLLDYYADDVGAVGGLVPQFCPPPPLPPDAANIISDLNRPNIQWFKHPTRKASIETKEKIDKEKAFVFDAIPNNVEVDHLTSSFIYRKGIVKYELSLSPASFREETLFTYELKRKGYKLIVNPNVITWHFRGESRHSNIQDWENDDKFFHEKLREWGVAGEQSKTIVVDAGIGDEIIVSTLIPELKKKYGKLIIACCHNEVYQDYIDEDVKLISIADAKQRLGSIDHLNIYRNMIDWNWKESLEGAFRKLYGI